MKIFQVRFDPKSTNPFGTCSIHCQLRQVFITRYLPYSLSSWSPPPTNITVTTIVVYYVYPRKCQCRSFRSSSVLLLALGLLRLYSAAFYAAYSVLNAPCFGWASRGVSRCPLIICSHQESTVNLFVNLGGNPLEFRCLFPASLVGWVSIETHYPQNEIHAKAPADS